MDARSLTFDNSPQLLQRWAGLYGTAILTTGLAIWGRSALQPWLGNQCEFSLFYLSVLATAWIAGTGPAIFAIVLGTIAAAHFFIEPSSSLFIEDVPDLVQLCIYFIVSVTATMLLSRLQRQRRLAENRSDENSRLSESLRLADERKDEFLALLAHELRNPLAPIRSSLALLERNSDLPDQVRRVSEIIGRQTNHLVRITDDLLDVSRFCRGKITLQMERLDLRDAVRDAVEMTEKLVEDNRHTMQSLLPEHPVWVDGDRVRLTQLIANLLGNAAKYTPTAGRIAVQVEANEEAVSLSVTDNGIGFAPEEAERILAPFAQIDTSRTREYGGLGLGLTIVSRLVAMHRGSLIAHSRGPGRGSRFTVTLPSASIRQSQDRLPAADFPPSTNDRFVDCTVHPRELGHKLLIVEDNTDASTILRELFEAEGFAVDVATNGLEALQAADGGRHDVILCDIGLPGMDGYEIAQRLRRGANTKHSHLIALTGWGSNADQELATQSGFDLHLTKPIGFCELLHHVQHQLSESVTRSQETAAEQCSATTRNPVSACNAM